MKNTAADDSTTEAFDNYLTTVCAATADTRVTDGYETAIPLSEGSDRAITLLQNVRDQEGTVYIIGNGGSASIASHMQNDLIKAVGVKAMVFTETPMLTAYSNDDGYAAAYANPLRMWASPGDLLIAISSSGQSENILRAVAVAQEAGARVVTLSGFTPNNTLRRTGDLNFYIPAGSYGTVELGHAMLCHYLTDRLSAAATTPQEPCTATLPPHGE